MCKIRGFRHACDHVDYRYMSICRGTISTENSPKTPLCLGRDSSEIVISLDDRCVACSFQTFRQNWESRISEAEKKRDSLQARLFNTASETTTWSSHPSWTTGSSWSACPSWDSHEQDDTISWYEFDEPIDATLDVPSTASDKQLSAGEESRLRLELAAAQAEVENLRQQFGHDMWHNWQGYFGTSTWTSPGRRPSHWKRQVTNPKVQCGSPLKKVSSVSDEPDLMSHISDLFSTPSLSSSEVSTDSESDYSDSPTLSITSAFSKHSYVNNFAVSEHYSSDTPTKPIKSGNVLDRTTTFSPIKRSEQSSSSSIMQCEDTDSDMLPNWMDFI